MVQKNDELKNKTKKIGYKRKLSTWSEDLLKCIKKIKNDVFTLKEVYSFESELKSLHPENNTIKAAIRWQLQILRDNGFIEFLGNGYYKKTMIP